MRGNGDWCAERGSGEEHGGACMAMVACAQGVAACAGVGRALCLQCPRVAAVSRFGRCAPSAEGPRGDFHRKLRKVNQNLLTYLPTTKNGPNRFSPSEGIA